jgi:hypothetical protein
MPYSLKARNTERKEASIARERLGNHFPAATDTDATIEKLLEAVFSVRSAPRFCEES